MNIIQKPTVFFDKGRKGINPFMVVIHIAEGTRDQVYDEFLHNTDNPKSSHYLICNDGTIWQFVKEEDTAFTEGFVIRPTAIEVVKRHAINPNLYCLSIENEGFAIQDITEIQYQTNAQLIADICQRRNIPIDRNHIIGHREIRADKTCPGKVDVDRLVRMVSGLLAQDAQKQAILTQEISLWQRIIVILKEMIGIK